MTDIQDRATDSAIAALELDLIELDLVTEEADLDPASPVLPVRGATRRAARTSRTIRRRTVLMWAATVLLTALVAVTLLFQASGGRWFVVQTPSMGTTAPVGTLLLTTPVLLEDLHVGDVVSFHPSTTPDETYTHRVIAVDADGITTRGDINGAVDPWKTDQAHLVGEATTILPGFGWLAKGVPLLLAGLVIVMVLTRPIGSPTRCAWSVFHGSTAPLMSPRVVIPSASWCSTPRPAATTSRRPSCRPACSPSASRPRAAPTPRSPPARSARSPRPRPRRAASTT